MQEPLEAFAEASAGVADEAGLVDRATGGDEEALCALLSHFGPIVRERLKSKIGPQWRASLDEDDVMQVTYLEAFLLIGQFKHRGSGSFLAWLSQVAENNLRDALRGLQAAKRPNPKRRVQVSRPNENSFVALVELLGATNSTPSRAAARDESERMIEDVLSGLPPDYERVVRLYDLEGRSAQEVAEQLGRSTGAIYMLRARAHEKMRGALGSASQFFTDPG
ncbi:MAG: sigma-70 family RNA polymerase sigma factor [Phycisphaeraceae bacterium]|nr:MAG: sigma-70 family RNA polymerase sigma factor [Phycisphaeraceae bacterium]